MEGLHTSKSSGQSADLVLGQPTLTMDGYATATRLYLPRNLAVDPTSGAVFVADTNRLPLSRPAGRAA